MKIEQKNVHIWIIGILVGLAVVGLGLTIFMVTRGSQGWGHKIFADGTDVPDNQVILYVGNDFITKGDVEWEYKLHTVGSFKAGESNPLLKLTGKDANVLMPLKERLMAGLVERKLLFKFIQKEGKFNLADPRRYVACMEEWQNTLRETEVFSFSAEDKEKMKTRLCEQSIIMQYLDKIVFAGIKITDPILMEYFKKNEDQFRKSNRVIIRQILLALDKDASSLRPKLNKLNFAEYARTYSISPEAEQGGVLGPFSKGEMPAVFDVAFSMRVGEISSIIKSTYGYHILYLERKLGDEPLKLADVKADVEKALLKELKEEEYRKLVELALDTIAIVTPRTAW